jgi:prophage DNA circulation protein
MPGMAWRDNLLDCSFRDVVFDVVGTKDAYGRAVSVAEYPYRDGGEVEDLGARPTRFSLQAIFFGDDYDARLRVLLAVLNTAGAGELIHPIWGSIKKAQVTGCEVTHAAPEPDACTVSLEFTESAAQRPFFEKLSCFQVQELVGLPGDEAVDAAVDAVAGIVDPLRVANPLAALDGLREAMLGPVQSFTAQVQGGVTSGLDVLSYPRAWARDLANLSNGLLDAANFPGRLMTEWRAITGVFANIGARWGFGASAGAPVGNATTVYVWPPASPWRAGTTPSEAQAQAVVRVCLTVINATAQADAAAMVLAEEAASPTLSPLEVETVINATRREIEAAMQTARAALPLEQCRAITEPLKTQALALQEAARAIIELRPPLARRRVEAPANLRLLAHRWYGDHARAPELARLNPSLRLPNFLQVGDVLNAFSL